MNFLKYFIFPIIFLSLFFVNNVFAGDAILFLSPSSGSFEVGKNFTVKLTVNSGGGAGINASEANLIFDKDYLSVAQITKDNSIFNLWTAEPAFSNSKGTISFGGGSPSAYTGSAGAIINITFKALKEGTANVSFVSGSVLAADGKGTEVLSKKNPGIYTLKKPAAPTPTSTPKPTPKPTPVATWQPTPTPKGDPPSAPLVSSPTHPDENKWYLNNNIEFVWDLSKDVDDVSFSFDQKPDSDPGLASQGAVKSKKFNDAQDGAWYFHIKLKNQYGWSRISHRRVLIDATSPLTFKIEVKRTSLWDSRPLLLFNTIDEASGISHYEIKIGDGDVFPVSVREVETNPYQMPEQAQGKHIVIVKAVDRAGNIREAVAEITVEPELEEKIAPFSFKNYWWLILLLLLLLILAVMIFLFFSRKQKKQCAADKKTIKEKIEKIKEKVGEVFGVLKQETEEQIKFADKKPKMSVSEYKVASRLKEALDISKEYINKKIEEIKEDIDEEEKK